MDNLFDTTRNILATVFSVAMAYFSPIEDMVFTIFFLFLVNCVVGMVAGMIVEREGFRLRKFVHCIAETLAFYLIVVCLFVVGRNMDNMEGALQAIGGVIYSILYFYSVNVLRNLCSLFPDSRPLLFLYYVVSFEFIKKLPALEGFSRYCREKEQRQQTKKE